MQPCRNGCISVTVNNVFRFRYFNGRSSNFLWTTGTQWQQKKWTKLHWNQCCLKLANPESPKGPPTVDRWAVRVIFGWSVFDVVRNNNKTKNIIYLYSTSYKKVWMIFQILQSLGNLTGGSAALLWSHTCHISKHMIIEYFKAMLQLRNITDLKIRHLTT